MVKYPASVRAGMSQAAPLQRLGTVEEHAWLVALLASPLGRALNGSTITLDGARDNWFGPWPPRGMADDSGEVPVEERRPRIDTSLTAGARGRMDTPVTCSMGVRAKCCGCTEAFQASRAGSIPVARLKATGSGAVW